MHFKAEEVKAKFVYPIMLSDKMATAFKCC